MNGRPGFPGPPGFQPPHPQGYPPPFFDKGALPPQQYNAGPPAFAPHSHAPPQRQTFHFSAPPAPTHPPSNTEVKVRIDKLVTYLVRNGPDFELMLKQKQQANPEFAFLSGGPDYAYYQWRLYCVVNNISEEQEKKLFDNHVGAALPFPGMGRGVPPAGTHPPPGLQQPHIPGTNMAALMPFDKEAEFKTILDSMTGAKESIKDTRRWIVDHADKYGRRISDLVRMKMESLGQPNANNFETKLHLIYLLNDVLHAYLKQRMDPSQVDAFSATLMHNLLAIFRAALVGTTADDKDKLIKVLRLWAKRDIYSPTYLDQLERDAMSDVHIPPLIAPDLPHHPASVPSHPPHPHVPHHAPPHMGPPPSMAPMGMAPPFMGGPPAHGFPGGPGQPFPMGMPPAAPPVPVAHPPPTSLEHLGPGFVVTLCKMNNVLPYVPLDPLKVPHHMPASYDQQPDPYTLSRVDDFYREVKKEEDKDKKHQKRSSSSSSSRSRSRSRSRSKSKTRKKSRSRSRSRSRPKEKEAASAHAKPPKRDRDRERDELSARPSFGV